MRILLAGLQEDDAEISGLLAGATTFTAGDAGELVKSVYGCAPDVIVADRALPGLAAALQQIATVLPAPVWWRARWWKPGPRLPRHTGCAKCARAPGAPRTRHLSGRVPDEERSQL